MIFLTTGGDERVDRRVEKSLRHVHRVERPELRYHHTRHGTADRLARKTRYLTSSRG
jgi:hypothetical protein